MKKLASHFFAALTKFKTQALMVFIFLFITVLWTWAIVFVHTAKPSPLTFDFKCKGTVATQPCDAEINEQQIQALGENIEMAIKNSHRLGKLSEIYLSVMRFTVMVKNESEGYIQIPPNERAYHRFLSATCGDETLNPDSSNIIEGFFAFSDSKDTLVDSIKAFTQSCGTVFLNADSVIGLPPVPPNANVTFDFGPKFLVEFKGDFWNWFIVWIFHALIFLGLLPIFKAGWQFIAYPRKYFKE